MTRGLAWQHFNLRIRLNRFVHGGDKVVETVYLGVDVLHRSKRLFGEFRNVIAKIANLLRVRLEFEVTLRNQLLNLSHHRRVALADVRDAFLLHDLAQT